MVSFLGFFNKGAVVEHGFVGLMPSGGHIEIFLILASDPCLVLKKRKKIWAMVCAIERQDRKEEGDILFNDALNTFNYCYMASHLW